jgi:hypothetical protein
VLGLASFASPWAGSKGRILVPVAAALVLALATRASPIERFLRRRPWARLLSSGAWAVLVTYFLLGENLKGRLGLVDDHVILTILGPEGRLSLSGWAEQLASHEEFGAPPLNYTRYRPGYHLLLYTECLLWGAQPTLWFGARLVLFGLSAFLAWNLLWRWLGGLAGSLVLLALLTYGFWSDIWCRLGPAEIYAVFGTALYLTGLVGVLEGTRARKVKAWPRRLGHWAALVAGALIAMGSKENFLLIVPCTWALAVWVWWRGRADVFTLAGTLLVSAAGLFIGGVVAISLRHTEVDVYSQSVAPRDRLRVLARLGPQFLHSPEGLALALAAGGLTLLWAWALYRRRGTPQFPQLLRVGKRGGLGLFVLALLFISQYVFYNGDWPNNTRYDFPGVLALPLGAALFGWMLLRILHALGVGPLGRRAAYAALLAALAAGVVYRGFEPIRTASKQYVAYTIRFNNQLDTIVARLAAEPARPVVFFSHHPLEDYEPVVSLRQFLRYRKVRNPIFLRLEGVRPDTLSTPLIKKLAAEMTDWSVKGLEGKFTPQDQMPPGKRPFGIGFSGPPTGDTVSLGRIW